MRDSQEDRDRAESRHASEYLANERTFLAWIRTSIAVVSLGFVVARFSVWLGQLAIATAAPPRTTGVSLHIGVAMMAFGGLLAALAVWRYHVLNEAIRKGEVRPHNALTTVVASGVVALAGAMILYMLFSPVRP